MGKTMSQLTSPKKIKEMMRGGDKMTQERTRTKAISNPIDLTQKQCRTAAVCNHTVFPENSSRATV